MKAARHTVTWRAFESGVALACALGLLLTPALASSSATRLTLEQALATAREEHPGLRARRAESRAAQAQVGEAIAGYLPRVDTSVQYQRSTRNWLPTPGMAGLQASTADRELLLGLDDTVNYATFGVALTQPIYDFGKTGGKVDAAQAQAAAAEASAQASAQDVEVGVRIAYYGVLAAQQAVQVASETRLNQAQHLERIRQLVDAGSRTRYDLVSAELKLDDAELALVRAHNGLQTARARLSNAMGTRGTAEYEVVEPAAEDASLEDQPPEDLLQAALGARPELTRSSSQIEVRRAEQHAAWAGYLPDLVATANLNGAAVDDVDPGLNWYVGVGLNWRVFEGLRTYRRSEASAALVAAGQAEHESLRQAVATEILVQRLAVDEARQRVQVAARALETAREKLRLAEGRYSGGSGSVLELEDAQVAHTGASFQVVQAGYDLAVARILLKRAVGR